jgi:hypothetical protein
MKFWYYIVENVSTADPIYKGLTTQILRIPDDIRGGVGRTIKRTIRFYKDGKTTGDRSISILLLIFFVMKQC